MYLFEAAEYKDMDDFTLNDFITENLSIIQV